MKKRTDDNILDFAKLALQRNDESIRFSETKAGFLLTFVSLLLGILITQVENLKQILIQDSLGRSYILIALVLIFIGIFMVLVASLVTIFPRLKVVKATSLLYFQHLVSLNEKDISSSFVNLKDKEKIEQIATQVLATAKIASRKFMLIQVAIIGTSAILLGSVFIMIGLFVY